MTAVRGVASVIHGGIKVLVELVAVGGETAQVVCAFTPGDLVSRRSRWRSLSSRAAER
jgi:hypothetical protein